MAKNHRRTLDILTKKHHSASDWDWRANTQLNYSTAHFVSPPTSLKAGGLGYFSHWDYAFLKTNLSGSLKEGRVIMWHYPTASHTMCAGPFFRSQELPPPNQCPRNGYEFRVNDANVQIYRWVDGVSTLKASASHTIPILYNGWTHWRFTWWEYPSPNPVPTLSMLIDREIADTWIQQLLYNETDALWSDSPINRVGFCIYTRSDNITEWQDDVEIYKPA